MPITEVDLSSNISVQNYKNSILNEIAENNQEIIQDEKNPAIKKASIMAASATTYNASAAVTYANKYALNPNHAYMNNESGGGDCTNFASQVLHEGGGIPMHSGNNGYNNCWFYSSSSNRSTSWAGAQYLYDYLFSSVSKINASATTFSGISTGDLIQLGTTSSITHSMIVTGIVSGSSGRTDLLVTYRSTAGYHKKNVLLSTRLGTRQYIHIAGSK
ncbi:hypothetical protein FACS1894132_12000 [Clostridia bacterium]|nr:hypothetical protein FACS1894132_12000 [Clostridia bacterium]